MYVTKEQVHVLKTKAHFEDQVVDMKIILNL